MKPTHRFALTGFVPVALVFVATVVRAQDLLSCWNVGPAKQAIVKSVVMALRITKEAPVNG